MKLRTAMFWAKDLSGKMGLTLYVYRDATSEAEPQDAYEYGEKSWLDLTHVPAGAIIAEYRNGVRVDRSTVPA